ncbi:MAG TPA: hypothetical protein ENN84_11200 [Candidatus Marinimicrobia bacterium]|nr:hypothetical protein [Candidatus Neomarinimicrobiota bacterium]
MLLLLISNSLYSADNFYPDMGIFRNSLRHINPLPLMTFREPVQYKFFDFRGSTAIYGLNGFNFNTYNPDLFIFDSTETTLTAAADKLSRTLIVLDLYPVRANLLRLLLDQNYLDYLIGIGLHAYIAPIPAGLNEGWQNRQVSGAYYRYQPEWYEISLANTLLYQPWQWLLFSFQYAGSLGYGTFYKNAAGTKAINMYGYSQRYDISISYLSAGRESFTQLAIGAHLFYSQSRFTLQDPFRLTPVLSFHPAALGAGIHVSLVLGGKKSAGSSARILLSERRYLEAKQQFTAYQQSFPRSMRTSLAQKFINYCDSMQFAEYYEKGNSALIAYRIFDALNFYEIAARSKNTKLRYQALRQRAYIAEIFAFEAMRYLREGDLEQAERLIISAVELSPILGGFLEPVQAQINLYRARSLIQYGLFSRAAIYLEKAESQDPELNPAISLMRQEIAAGHISDLNRAVEENDLQMAKNSLRNALLADKRIQEIATNYINEANKKIEWLKSSQARESAGSIFLKMQEEHYASFKMQEKNNEIKTGMLSSEVREKIGEPHKLKKIHSGSSIDYQLWIYLDIDKQVYLYFHNAVLMFIETAPR